MGGKVPAGVCSIHPDYCWHMVVKVPTEFEVKYRISSTSIIYAANHPPAAIRSNQDNIVHHFACTSQRVGVCQI